MKKRSNKYRIVASILIGLLLILVGLVPIYYNGKTDGFDSGTIKVSSCTVDNYNWGIYTCYGDYTSNAAMIETSNVSVKVGEGGSARGDYINDVYPVFPSTKETAHTFITGRDRASVEHNIPWIILIFVGLLLPIGVGTYSLGIRKANNEFSNEKTPKGSQAYSEFLSGLVSCRDIGPETRY